MTDEETKKDDMSVEQMAKELLDALNNTKVTDGTKIIIECISDDGDSERMSLHQEIYGTFIQLIKMIHAAMQTDNDFKKVIKAVAMLDEIAVSHTIPQAKTKIHEEEN